VLFRQRCDLSAYRLEYLTLAEIRDDQAEQLVSSRLLHFGRNKTAGTDFPRYQPFLLQPRQSFRHGRPGDTVLIRQLMFRRQFVPLEKMPLAQGLFEIVVDAGVFRRFLESLGF